MNALASNINAPPGDTILWGSFDAAGWHALDLFHAAPIPMECGQLDLDAWRQRKAELLRAAHIRFTKALSFIAAGSVSAAQSTIGLVWTEYFQLLQRRSPDPEVTHASQVSSLLAKSTNAKRILESASLNAEEQLYLAYAYHLVGLLELESCQGHLAEVNLNLASDRYKTLGQNKKYCDVVHLRAKLMQCKQCFGMSIELLVKAEQSEDLERRVRAFLDRVATLHWIGQTREAWQCYATWKQLRKLLDANLQAGLSQRGNMLFAFIATHFGDLSSASDLFSKIDEMRGCNPASDFCDAVYRTIRAEYCLERGDIPAMEKWLEGISWASPIPRSGYDCFEILFLGSSCRQCILECVTCEVLCCNPCNHCCEPHTVVVNTDTKSVPVEIQRMLTLMMDGLRGRAHFANGDLTKAERALAQVVQELPSVFPTASAVNLPYKVALLRVLQARDNDGTRIRACSNEVLNQIEKCKRPSPQNCPSEKLEAKRLAAQSEVERVLGLWRSELSEDDVAKNLLEGALRKSLTAKYSQHPEVLALRAELIHVRSNLPSSDLSQLSTEINLLIEELSKVVDCLDHRLLSAYRTAAWISLLGHCFSQATYCFTRLERRWLELQRRNNASLEVGDARVILGSVAAQIESGTPMSEVTEQLHRGIQQIVANSSLSSLAHDLNRLAVILDWHNCFQSSYFFAKKSLDQYESMNDAANAAIVRKSILAIQADAQAAGVELETL